MTKKSNTVGVANLVFKPENDQLEENNIIFSINTEPTKEMLRISQEGFFIEGRKVVDDYEVYKAFMEWFNECQKQEGKEPLEIKKKFVKKI